ncbi:MAG: 2,3-dimethylmalate dehydratase small subunit [Syntrophaceae bacterium PtaU1.Bin231]|nr:MAG: 2,3-dimethylmalate dehydratase small subunit [Syntrophaceae bacterium PtaU1.Bin231]HOG15748.1 3-isopropylmalate dehydratase small subunit [Syntrophales bacterium]
MAGRAWKFGNDVDTDAIIPGRFLTNWNKHPERLKDFCFADARPEFAAGVRPGDVVVAGRNFGCGSSREGAPVAIRMTGVAVVIASSFARIFFRNAINVGLLPLESPEAAQDIRDGDLLEIDAVKGEIRNLTGGRAYAFKPLPAFLQEMLAGGGLARYVQRRLGITDC